VAKKAVKPLKLIAKKTAKPGKAPAAKKASANKRAIVVNPAPAIAMAHSPSVLDRLWAVVLERRHADPAFSHSARLLSRGVTKVAQKFGEEAVECLIEAVAGNQPALVAESADVLYHLLVLWVSAGVQPSEVWAELERREGVSGIAEKAARRAMLPGPITRKIP